MASLLSQGFQWVLNVFSSCIATWAQRLLIKVFWMMVLIMGVSLLLFVTLPVMNKGDNSVTNTGQAVSVTTQRWWKPSSFMGYLKDALLYTLAQLHFQEPLTIANLLRHRDQLGNMNYMLQACFNLAIDVFVQEPLEVQENAQMVIQCGGPPIEFLSGNGDCEISVYLLYDKIQLTIRERTAEMYLLRLSTRKEPLSVRNLLSVKHGLESRGILSEEMSGCLEFAVEEFAEEPHLVQDNARLVIDCGGNVLRFASGREENDINIYDVRGGTIHYRIRSSGVITSIARFFNRNKDHSYTRAKKTLQLE